MDFEQALVYELSTIPNLSGRVFPQTAPEDTNPPFVLYISSEGEKVQTLGGYVDNKEVNVTIQAVASTYLDLKSLIRQVIDKVVSFFGRPIGVDGPTVQAFEYSEPTEEFNEELNFHSSTFDIKVNL
jgi:hypothetical protein